MLDEEKGHILKIFNSNLDSLINFGIKRIVLIPLKRVYLFLKIAEK